MGTKQLLAMILGGLSVMVLSVWAEDGNRQMFDIHTPETEEVR